MSRTESRDLVPGALDATTIGAAILVLGPCRRGCGLLPARRANATDPLMALRAE
jgi:hypothetical protein